MTEGERHDGHGDDDGVRSQSRRLSDQRRKVQPEQRQSLWTRPWEETPEHLVRDMRRDVVVDCGWGRLVFAQTFDEPTDIISLLGAEEEGRRDIAMYVADSHVLISQAPDELFIDPSLTYRLELHRYRPRRNLVPGVFVRAMNELADADEINRIYTAQGMVTADPELMWSNQRTRTFTYLVAQDEHTGQIIGTVTGIDHVFAFDDPDNGASLWSLAVDPQSTVPGVGEALVRVLAERYIGRTRNHLDLSVIHDNDPAIRLYKKLGFRRVPVFSVKRKNPINEPLFAAEPEAEFSELNPYARIIADEARRRGIAVETTDVESDEMRLTHGGRRIVTRESLSELTTAVAMSRCDDKLATRRIFERAGLSVARGRLAGDTDADRAFLAEVGEVVVKPARGEQGRGITVGVTEPDALARAVEHAHTFCPQVLLEECVSGEDLRIIVIGHEVIAAAVRRPAMVYGTGRHTVAQLIETHSRRRSAATGGESRIPLDDTTEETVRLSGYTLDSVLAEGEALRVRRTANLHTGGTIHDVTAILHPSLAEAATSASEAIDIPVTGLDMIVTAPDQPHYVLVEANERPGLANHEPQPTAAAFIDLLFPATRATPRAWTPAPPSSSA
ncbi:GNAT-family acetyltransferase (TIGR03103 family) [Haloactinopolyspora alba]|uniref:GNAT-family acetyltransferase (TIGR03103 family) n=1 Tax=Haloactinopolyspora alba TaxID=648780 RepID=A0A2P8DEA5_9ACTN|nr:N-acetylglutaminylglutamine synthetase [Haloactinopolyspora alba]PSK95564.1 GNAT-family acetyltransferase (TIGR03103 family) [Haloactinopolyspora alba]